jgi:hypothetical protein
MNQIDADLVAVDGVRCSMILFESETHGVAHPEHAPPELAAAHPHPVVHLLVPRPEPNLCSNIDLSS